MFFKRLHRTAIVQIASAHLQYGTYGYGKSPMNSVFRELGGGVSLK